jgi:hypothetical protein
MAISLEGRVYWRTTAPFHVQFQLEKEEHVKIPSAIFMGGQVVRVFRSDGRLGLGDRVRFKIWLCQPGDEPTGPAFIYHSAFTRARYIEAYLHGQPPDCDLAAYELEVLSAPTDEPTMSVAQLQHLGVPVSFPAQAQSIQKKGWWKRLLSKRIAHDL